MKSYNTISSLMVAASKLERKSQCRLTFKVEADGAKFKPVFLIESNGPTEEFFKSNNFASTKA